MSNQTERYRHSRRLHTRARAIKRQLRIRRSHALGFSSMTESGARNDQPHRYHKLSGMTCGDSRCAMCGNPRKFFKQRTIQEKRAMQDIQDTDTGEDNG